MRKKAIVWGLTIILLCAGCGRAGDQGASPNAHVERIKSAYTAEDVDPGLVQASNGFGLSLAEKLMAERPAENVWLSPVSITAALALVSTGGAGRTGAEMLESLGLGGRDADEVGQGYRVLIDLLSHPADDGVETSIASSLWLKEGKPFLDDFVARSRDDFGAEVRRADFADPATLEEINEWTEQATRGRIERMLENTEAEAAMYVLNAVYFNAAWKRPFDPERTTDGRFRISDALTLPVKMMSAGGYYEYAGKDGYEAVRLPYGENGSAYLAVLMPDEGVSVPDLARALADEPQRLTEPYDFHQGRIDIPRVQLEYSAGLEEELKRSGMSEAFDPERADFSAMAPEPPNLFISRVKHRTALSLDEKGTEAAAATSVEMLAGAAPPDQPFHMTVDRPFIAAIVDRATGCILFAGAVFHPGDVR
ncbi:serpin family protein [Cohnella hongkongensis]|uniref:Serpin family protein n=1 Tax=Cohnella hongkongensis TaxID=178337 RepID=A0ABV9FCV2_9BACL